MPEQDWLVTMGVRDSSPDSVALVSISSQWILIGSAALPAAIACQVFDENWGVLLELYLYEWLRHMVV